MNLEPHEVNPDFPGPGSFIIDKNINHDKMEPSSMLFPEYKDIQLNTMHFVKGHVKDPDGLA